MTKTLKTENKKQIEPIVTENNVVQKKLYKLLYVTAECQPFIGTGGLGEVAGSLPKAIAKEGEFEVKVILPLYSDIPDSVRKQMTFVRKFSVMLGWRQQYCGLYSLTKDKVEYLFVDNEYYFKRSGIYGHYDDGERFAYFSKSVIETMLKTEYYPDVINCNDWQTALVPVFLKTQFGQQPELKSIKTVFTIHNIEYQGKYSLSILEDVFGIANIYTDSLEYSGLINLVKGAIEYSDQVSTVSPTYAKELESPYFSHGLNHVIVKNRYKMKGILNGIDTDGYNPKSDPALFKNYNAENLTGKADNKKSLQQMLNLPEREDVPLIAVISRLVPHKGMDLIRDCMDELMQDSVQFVLLGKGDALYENFFTDMQKTYSEKFRAVIAFNMDTSRKIYAASDLFLMPSRSEPCGLSQMISSRYGSVPVVRETGGLFDSIKDAGTLGGNGFTFAPYNKNDLLNRVRAGCEMYRSDRENFIKLQKRAMTTDFSWNKSAVQYCEMYKKLINV